MKQLGGMVSLWSLTRNDNGWWAFTLLSTLAGSVSSCPLIGSLGTRPAITLDEIECEDPFIRLDDGAKHLYKENATFIECTDDSMNNLQTPTDEILCFKCQQTLQVKVLGISPVIPTHAGWYAHWQREQHSDGKFCSWPGQLKSHKRWASLKCENAHNYILDALASSALKRTYLCVPQSGQIFVAFVYLGFFAVLFFATLEPVPFFATDLWFWFKKGKWTGILFPGSLGFKEGPLGCNFAALIFFCVLCQSDSLCIFGFRGGKPGPPCTDCLASRMISSGGW